MSLKHDQNSVPNKVKATLKKFNLVKPGDLIIVALSGGADSIALTEIMCDLSDILNISVAACHYNHKLRGEEGDADEKFVVDYCASRGIPLTIGRKAPLEKIDNEDDARNLRYKFFEKILEGQSREEAKIAIAHHMNDLSETFLMRVIRGGGLKGLSSIVPRRKKFIRPLLFISRKEIEMFLGERQVNYCTDSTNLNNDYFRNQIRNQLLPDLSHYNPSIVETLAQEAISIAEDYSYISLQAENIMSQIAEDSDGKIRIKRSDFILLHPSLQSHLLMSCLEKFNAKDFTYGQIKKIIELVINNRGKKILPLPHSLRFELKDGNIYIYKEPVFNKKEHNADPKKK